MHASDDTPARLCDIYIYSNIVQTSWYAVSKHAYVLEGQSVVCRVMITYML
jgi:hypothetical protein